MITKNAYAKVNLSLDIVGRRDDGYHLVRMVMQSLDIKDILTFTKTEVSNPDERIKIELKLEEEAENKAQNNVAEKSSSLDDTDSKDNLGIVPLGKDNLIYKVAELLLSKYVWPEAPNSGVKITLEKHIPIAAGMAGGSSDAAATFRGINDLFDLGIMDQDLMDMAVPLGADIPYCIMGGTALSEGIGEVLTKLPAIPECIFLVAKPTISVSTAEAYGGYDKLAESSKPGMITHPDVDGQVDAIYSGSLRGITDRFANVLEYVTAENHEEIGILENIMKQCGAVNAMMSGSGPTVFGIYDDKSKAEEAEKKLLETGIIESTFITTAI